MKHAERITDDDVARAALEIVGQIGKEYAGRLDVLSDSDVSDADYNAAEKSLFEKERAEKAPFFVIAEALCYPAVREEWFARFVASFGECEYRRISARQEDVITRNAGRRFDKSGRVTYGARVGDLFVRASVHRDCGFVSVLRIDSGALERARKLVSDRAERISAFRAGLRTAEN